MAGRFWIVHLSMAAMLLSGMLVQDALSSPIITVQKRGARRIPRARYRVGYMFGKRASQTSTSSSKVLDAITSRLLTDADLAAILQRDPQTLLKVATLIDKDNDGYITMSDFL